MSNIENERPFRAVKRQAFLEKGFELFSEKGIDSVTMQDVANASHYGVATLYRYFNTKQILVIAIAASKWENYLKETSIYQWDGMTAAQIFINYLDSFIDLYRNHKNILRFNQFFNIFVKSGPVDSDAMKPYYAVIQNIYNAFHEMYQLAESDHTLYTDVPEKELFSTTLHLMLAAVTRYAVGLVYEPYSGYDVEQELFTLREMLIDKYVTKTAA